MSHFATCVEDFGIELPSMRAIYYMRNDCYF